MADTATGWACSGSLAVSAGPGTGALASDHPSVLALAIRSSAASGSAGPGSADLALADSAMAGSVATTPTTPAATAVELAEGEVELAAVGAWCTVGWEMVGA